MICRGRGLIRQFGLVLGLWAMVAMASLAQGPLDVRPAIILLDNPEATQQLLVRSTDLSADLTRLATYEVLDPAIAVIRATGGVRSGAACEAEVAGSAGPEVVSGLVVPHVPSSPSWTQT